MKIVQPLLLAVLALGRLTAVAGTVEPDTKPLSASPSSPGLFGAGQFVPLPADFALEPPRDPAISATCDRCPSYHGLMFGVGMYLMQARFDNNMAFGLQGTANRSPGPIPPGNPGVRVAERIEIDHDFVAAPEIWLGYMSDSGLGVRARYWYFREGTLQTLNAAEAGVPGAMLFSAAPLGLGLVNATKTMEATSRLQVQVWDGEAQYNLRTAGWNMLFSGGVRVARIDQSYNAFVPQTGNNTLLSSNTFQGAGPTLALELRRPIWSTWLNLYGSLRGSIVFGEGHQEASVPDQNVVAKDQRDIGIWIGEVELGLETSHTIGRSRLFGQVAVVGQNWSGAGSASRSSVNVLPGGSFVGAAYTGESDLNFLGLAIRLGVDF